ncbi:MAG: hypothetical protein V2I54_08590 [Bacteroidales bacterium]|jgi:hypothetical protein|nr:hypothetical protein [Bacteroidales bacterium]
MAKLIIKRKKEWNNRARKFRLYIDGEKIDHIGNGEIKEFELDSGKHTVTAKMDWMSSPEFEVELYGDKSKTIEISTYKLGRYLIPFLFGLLVLALVLEHVFHVEVRFLFYFFIPPLLVSIYYSTFGRKKFIEIKEWGIA